MTDRRLLWRMAFIVLLMTGVWSALGVRLALLHLGPNEELKERAESMWSFTREFVAGRGRIYDSTGGTLALDLDTKDIIANPMGIQQAGQVHAIAKQLSDTLGIPISKVVARINKPGRKFEYIQQYVHPDVIERLEPLKLGGIYMKDSSARYYPHESMLCHVVGFANLASKGSAGVELQLESKLKGRSGLRVSEQDRKGREIYSRRSLNVAPEQGCDVYLTVDINIQYVVEQALQSVVHEHNAKGAWAIVQEVKTGRILAMASLPAFDLNHYRSTHPDQRRNSAIGYPYEPGSTMKAAVLAAAFNEGIVTEDMQIDCEGGIWYYRGRSLKDFHAYGILSVADVLKKSSNIGAAKIALHLGPQRLEQYMRDFGIGRRTGIDLPGEEKGVFASRHDWDGLTITRLPMGHAVLVTAMQMVCMYSAIANDGMLLKPHIVDRIVDAQQNVIHKSKVEVVGQPITPETSRLMRRLLKRVTEQGGTARRARIAGYDVAGKTGTTEKVINGQYVKHANIASFAGFLPAENPEVSILVVVDEPHRAHTGGRVAAPVFKEISEQIVRYLGIPPGGQDDLQVTGGQMITQAVGEHRRFEVQ